MLNELEQKKPVSAKVFDDTLPGLKDRLAIAQRAHYREKIPVIIIIEGWNAAGITMVTKAIIDALDPRGFTLHAIDIPTDEERMRPFMWRFWIRTPLRGRIALFARGWYSRAISSEMQKVSWKKSLKGRTISINNFERILSDDGTIIIKIFLQISNAEQRRRLEEREKNPLTAWLVTPAIWNLHRHYADSLPIIDEFLEKTSTGYAPWHIVDAMDRNSTILSVYSILLETLEKEVSDGKESSSRKDKSTDLQKPKKNPVKRQSIPDVVCNKEECQPVLDELQKEMLDLHSLIFKRKIPLIILYEGWDAAGKGGNITRISRYMNPLGYDVIPVGPPDETEMNHHYLWRFVRNFPRAGHVAFYDRSWYGRVLVERVEGFAKKSEWHRAFQEINELEEDYIYSSGGGIIKFWLEISREEQLKRFRQRENDPLKVHKITDEDWRNREKWLQYEEAVDEMLARTNTSIAPWTVIASDDKLFARVTATRSVVECIRSLL
ncbi:MAG TPA: polyphosphate:AMP phosphotransferase [Methanoregulaceae archaeon]|nr:polyphosphate:AMP phosphotransferase [Methanoregulaceae archaeon]